MVTIDGAGARARRVAVVGGGPAGAFAARGLAERGVSVDLYHCEPSHGEKPCGGGVTLKAFDAFPELHRLGIDANPVHRARIRSPRGRELVIERAAPLFYIYSRGELDAALRRIAAEKGAAIRNAQVTRAVIDRGGVRVEFEGGADHYDYVVGADGAFSRVRRMLGSAPQKQYLCPAVDELVEGVAPDAGVTLAFFADITGYLWIFPRKRLASAGLVAREGELRGDLMRKRVRDFIGKSMPNAKIVRSAGWSIPAPGPGGELGAPVAGDRHVLAGDAALLADPITGEGIYYAMLSGKLAADALAAGSPADYEKLLFSSLGDELRNAARWTARYFRPRYIEAVLLASRYSRRTRNVLIDILSGRQRYGALDRRLRDELGVLGLVLRKI